MVEVNQLRADQETRDERSSRMRLLMTIKEAAVHWRVHPATIWRWMKSERIPSEAIQKIGSGRRLIDVICAENCWNNNPDLKPKGLNQSSLLETACRILEDQ